MHRSENSRRMFLGWAILGAGISRAWAACPASLHTSANMCLCEMTYLRSLTAWRATNLRPAGQVQKTFCCRPTKAGGVQFYRPTKNAKASVNGAFLSAFWLFFDVFGMPGKWRDGLPGFKIRRWQPWVGGGCGVCGSCSRMGGVQRSQVSESRPGAPNHLGMAAHRPPAAI
jgi:hypothetical protein